MARKRKLSPKSSSHPRVSFDIENSPYFIPVAFVVIFLALVLLFSDFLFSDQMLHSSDQIQAGVFFRQLLVDHVAEHGAVPQWNPYIFGGMPYIEAFHGDIFYPLSIMKFFGSLPRMLGMIMFLHIFLAGLFMYFAARQFRLSRTAALLSATCYMFASYLISQVAPGHDGKIFVTTLFPLVMLFLDRAFDEKPFLNFSLLGLVIGVIILSPHPQMSYFTLWAVALYALYRLVMLWRDKGKISLLARPAVLTTYAVVIGLLISAIQFYPGYVYTSEYSPRADSKKGWEWATSWSLHEEEAMSLLIPEFAGTSTKKTQTAYWGKNYFKDNSEAVGVVTMFVALFGLFFSRRKKAWFFGGLALFVLLYALGATTPLFKVFYYLIPKVKALRAPSMIMFIFSFSAALLAGMGVQRLIDQRQESKVIDDRKFRWLLFGFPGLLLLLAVLFGIAGRGMIGAWCSLFWSEAATMQVSQGMTKLDLAYYNLPAIQSGAWLSFVFTALAAVCIWLFKAGKLGTSALVALAFIPVIDGVRFNSRFVSTYDHHQAFAPNAITQFFTQKTDEHFRVMNIRVMQEDLLPHHRVPVVVGYHGNQLRWYDDLLGGPQLANQGNPRFLNLMGAKYLAVPANQQFPESYFGSAPVRVAATFGGAAIVQNDNAFPRVYLVNKFRLFGDRQEIYPEVMNSTDDLRQLVYLEEEPSIDIATDSLAGDSAWIIDYAEDTVLIGVSCTANRLLVLTDNYYDAWQVAIDGHPAPLMRAYGSLRAVAVPAGAMGVSFVYKSTRYRTGKLVTWLTSLYLLGIFSIYGFRAIRRRKSKEGLD
ncbi:MAG: YfhO family protein [candidate division Zixibacteria bacterium]|nr:YfhO family protein [candidate division Zixibacteria bacterium]